MHNLPRRPWRCLPVDAYQLAVHENEMRRRESHHDQPASVPLNRRVRCRATRSTCHTAIAMDAMLARVVSGLASNSDTNARNCRASPANLLQVLESRCGRILPASKLLYLARILSNQSRTEPNGAVVSRLMHRARAYATAQTTVGSSGSRSHEVVHHSWPARSGQK